MRAGGHAKQYYMQKSIRLPMIICMRRENKNHLFLADEYVVHIRDIPFDFRGEKCARMGELAPDNGLLNVTSAQFA